MSLSLLVSVCQPLVIDIKQEKLYFTYGLYVSDGQRAKMWPCHVGEKTYKNFVSNFLLGMIDLKIGISR